MKLRPPTRGDAGTVIELINAADVAETGETDFTLADVHEEWSARGFDLARDAVIVEHAGVAIGYAILRDHGHVMPSTLDPEADRSLLDWAEQHAHFRQPVGDNPRRRALLEQRGYTRVRSYSRMRRAVTGDEPAGFREMTPQDAPTLYAISEAAFSVLPDYEGNTEERFREEHLERHDVDPELCRVADHGFALVQRWEREAHIDLLAVDPAHQGHGLGERLLHAAFRAAADAGVGEVSLGVASDNPRALGLYTRAGMHEAWRVDAYDKPVPH